MIQRVSPGAAKIAFDFERNLVKVTMNAKIIISFAMVVFCWHGMIHIIATFFLIVTAKEAFRGMPCYSAFQCFLLWYNSSLLVKNQVCLTNYGLSFSAFCILHRFFIRKFVQNFTKYDKEKIVILHSWCTILQWYNGSSGA